MFFINNLLLLRFLLVGFRIHAWFLPDSISLIMVAQSDLKFHHSLFIYSLAFFHKECSLISHLFIFLKYQFRLTNSSFILWSLLILKLKLSQLWPVGASSSWLLCPFGIPPPCFDRSLLSDTEWSSLSIFSASALEAAISPRSSAWECLVLHILAKGDFSHCLIFANLIGQK